MIRPTLILLILSLTVLGCGSPSIERGFELEHNLPEFEATDDPIRTPPSTDTPQPTTTVNPTDIHTSTATSIIQPTATQTPSNKSEILTLIPSQPLTITQISMINPMDGWAIGHQINSGDRILYTQDSGFTWEERTPPISGTVEQNANIFHAWAYFYDDEIAWAIYQPQGRPPPIQDPVIWRTTDAGQTWEISEPLSLTGAESFFKPETISFIDPLRGWMLIHVDAGMSHDYSNLYTTSDGGKSWQRLIDPYGEGLQSLHNTGLAFADSYFGWVTKDNLAVMPGTFIEQTEDGGQTWEDIFLPAPDQLDWFTQISQCATSDPIFFDDIKGIVLVNCHTFDDQTFTYTYLSSDQGQSWQSTQLPTNVQSLYFINSIFGWAFGRDFYQTSDGGLNWVKIKTVSWDGQFSFVDQTTGWAVATTDEAIALVFTEDGGENWQLIKPKIR